MTMSAGAWRMVYPTDGQPERERWQAALDALIKTRLVDEAGDNSSARAVYRVTSQGYSRAEELIKQRPEAKP